jgi:hypothetical protein
MSTSPRFAVQQCGVYFGERDDTAVHGTRGAVCIRPAGHPEVHEDGIGHSSTAAPELVVRANGTLGWSR